MIAKDVADSAGRKTSFTDSGNANCTTLPRPRGHCEHRRGSYGALAFGLLRGFGCATWNLLDLISDLLPRFA